MKYLSTNLLEDLYSQTEHSIDKVIREWQQIPIESMNLQPGTNQWSAAQCLEHLNSYGRYYLPAIEKAIRKASGTKPALYFESGWLGNYFYKLMLPGSDGKPVKKMISPKDHQPAATLNASEVLDNFISQQEKLGQLLLLSGNIDLNKAKVAISIAPFIRLKLGDVLLFFVAHIQRHLLQAQRAFNANSKQVVNGDIQLV